MTVGDSNDFHPYVHNAIDKEKGKARQLRTPCALRRLWPTLWSFQDFPAGKFKFLYEARCGQLASLAIPTRYVLSLRNRSGVKCQLAGGH
jgi:hypothetical protein